jgi:alpha-N-arabinofuranosidase
LHFDTDYLNVNGTILTANDVNSFNFMDNRTAVVPRKLEGLSKLVLVKEKSDLVTEWKWEVPRWSITVLQFHQSQK